MRHNKHNTETTKSRFLGTISAFSIRNHHNAMEERAAEENEVVEKDGERKTERMGSEAMESSAHLAYPPRRSCLLNANLSSPFHFFFLLPPLLTDLAWVFSFFRRSHLSFSFVAVGWFSWLGLLLWVLFLWLWVGFEIGISGFDYYFFFLNN